MVKGIEHWGGCLCVNRDEGWGSCIILVTPFWSRSGAYTYTSCGASASTLMTLIKTLISWTETKRMWTLSIKHTCKTERRKRLTYHNPCDTQHHSWASFSSINACQPDQYVHTAGGIWLDRLSHLHNSLSIDIRAHTSEEKTAQVHTGTAHHKLNWQHQGQG